ncbi:MAG: type III-B CRISPR module-associated Cmr3 family protein [Myxococcota bacterium]
MSTMRHYRLQAIDSWFFRGARPFNLGEGGQADVDTLFPPWPDTVVGAMRAAWARGQGWQRGPWDKTLMGLLGDGFDDDALGPLKFEGPYMLSWDPDASASDGPDPTSVQLWYPMPLHVVGARKPGEDRWQPLGHLVPGCEAMCDLGEKVKLPDTRQRSVRTDEQLWVSSTGMQRVLEGGLPQEKEIRSNDQLWVSEPRVGLRRDNSIRTAMKRHLYSSRHVRLHRGVGLGLAASGWSRETARLLMLGGESRMAECDEIQAWSHPEVQPNDLDSEQRLALVLVTPARLSGDTSQLQPGQPPDGLSGCRLISACTGKAKRVGGWSSVDRSSRAVFSHLPAGTVLFVECDDTARAWLDQVRSDRARLGQRTAWGYGQFVAGVVPSS